MKIHKNKLIQYYNKIVNRFIIKKIIQLKIKYYLKIINKKLFLLKVQIINKQV